MLFIQKYLYYMLMTLPVKDIAHKLIPACIHVDNTSRVQCVSPAINPRFYSIIQAFYNKSKVPAVLNTSFN